jgi:HEAT repeat protein
MKHILISLLACAVVGTASAADHAPPNENEKLALAALEGLMTQPGDRALPIIKKVLAGNQTPLVKRRALFVLSQIDSAEARQILGQMAKSPDAGMRREAIRSIGIGGNAEALDGLRAIYDAGDEAARKDVLQAWLIAGRKEAVYQVAVAAKTDDEAREAIKMLGVMGATEELRKLSTQSKGASGLVEAYAISGDLASLRKIAEGTGERSVRLNAIRKIGIVQGDGARTALREIYRRNTEPEFRDAALDGMRIAGDEEGVLALYREAKTADEKRALLRVLSTMDGDAALQAIDAALESGK